MNKTQKKLNKLSKGKISKWGKDADFRLINRKWLLYSSNIARRLLAGIEDTENMNQKILADKVGVSAQYINKVLKGGENLTLETIGKLSNAIGQELISFPPYKYSIPAHQMWNSNSNNIINWGTSSVMGILVAPIVLQENISSVNSNSSYIINKNSLNELRAAIIPDSNSLVHSIESDIKLLPHNIK
jgi:transcriptional regulator with XRE-family HTH domain